LLVGQHQVVDLQVLLLNHVLKQLLVEGVLLQRLIHSEKKIGKMSEKIAAKLIRVKMSSDIHEHNHQYIGG
jgi:hypothetical protein